MKGILSTLSTRDNFDFGFGPSGNPSTTDLSECNRVGMKSCAFTMSLCPFSLSIIGAVRTS